MVSRTYDLETRGFVELFEELFFPRCDPGSRAFTDRLATVSMVVAPIHHYTKYRSSDLAMISMMLVQSERNDEPPVPTQ
jgi:hypothetical protein